MRHLPAGRTGRALALVRRTAVAVALLALATPVFAGFDAWGGKALSFGNGEVTRANTVAIQPLITQLMKAKDATNPFGPNAGLGLSQAEAEQRVEEIRKNVKKIVDLAKARSTEARAKFLDDQFKAGNICISWGMKARGTCDIDKVAGKTAAEKIAIAAKDVVMGPLACHDPVIVTLSATIAHENTHAGQVYESVGVPADPTPEQTKAGLGKSYACNEVEAHGNNETWKDAMHDALCVADNIDPDPTKGIPEGTDPAIAMVLRSIKKAADPAAAAEKLKKAMDDESDADKLAKECYTKAKEAFQKFIDGMLTKDELSDALNTDTWKHYTSWLDHPAFVSEQLPATITQASTLDATDGPDIATGLTQIQDFFVWPINATDNVLLVAGIDAGGTFGELQVYADTNGDTLFEPGTKQVLFTGSTQLQLNMDLFREPVSGDLFAYDGRDHVLYGLQDTNNDDIPDTLGPPVSASDPVFEDYFQFEFAVEAPFPRIVGYQQIDLLTPSAPHDDTVLVIEDQDTDGFFETVFEVTFDDFLRWEPTIEPATFEHLSPTVDVFGMPGAALEVWLTDDSGAPLQLRGFAIGQGIAASETVVLSTPFQYGEQLLVIDTTNGLVSPNQLLSPWEDLGNALDGSLGLPVLEGEGILAAGQLIQLQLSNALPFGNSTLIVGISQINVPFKGGVIVPDLDLTIFGLPIGGTGQLTLPALWPPAVPPGFDFFFQHWLADPGSPKGFASSNAVAGTSS